MPFGNEQRIVTKPPFTPCAVNQMTFNHAVEGRAFSAAPGCNKHTTKAGSRGLETRVAACQLGEDAFPVVGIGGSHSGIAGRMNTGLPPEGVDFDPDVALSRYMQRRRGEEAVATPLTVKTLPAVQSARRRLVSSFVATASERW